MEIVRDTVLEHGILFWPIRPERASMLVVLKATFALPASGVAQLASVQDPVSGPLPWDDDPEQSARTPNDLALLKPESECLVIGSCRTLTAEPVTRTAASFRVGPIGKTLVVHGDRRWVRGQPSSPTPFRVMPLRWERAFGGPSDERNPRGRGIATDANGDAWLPNLEEEGRLIQAPDQRPPPAGCGPIPITYAARTSLAGTYDAAWRAGRFPWFPEDFRYAFYNEAPADQRIDEPWRGDEPIALRHLHPEHASVQTRLPGLRARAFVERDDGSFGEVALALDTITIDADHGVALAVWRGLVELAHDRLQPDGIARLFTMHEDAKANTSLVECRARMQAVIGAAKAAELALAGEEPPPFDAPTELEPAPAPAIEPPSNADFGRERLEQLVAELRRAGVDPDRWLAEANMPTPLAPPDPEKLRAAFHAMGLELPKELEDVIRDVAAGPPQREPASGPRGRETIDLRALAIDAHKRGRPLKGDFTGANFAELDLRGLDARGAILIDANLRGANLSGAKLDGANLARADFVLANLTAASFVGCDLAGAVLDEARLSEARLDDATLEGAEMARAVLDGAHLRGTDLTGAVLEGTSFANVTADCAIFDRARASGCRFAHARLVEARFYATDLREAVFDRANLERARLGRGSDLSGASLRQASASSSFWRGAILDRALFARTELRGADFTGARLVETHLGGCGLRGAVFHGSDLAGAILRDADVFEGSFREANLAGADLRGANLYCADFFRAFGHQVALDGANLDGTYWERT